MCSSAAFSPLGERHEAPTLSCKHHAHLEAPKVPRGEKSAGVSEGAPPKTRAAAELIIMPLDSTITFVASKSFLVAWAAD